MRQLLAIVVLLAPIRSGHEVGVRLEVEVVPTDTAGQPMPAVVLFDRDRDGKRDDLREGCFAVLGEGVLTATCLTPLDDSSRSAP